MSLYKRLCLAAALTLPFGAKAAHADDVRQVSASVDALVFDTANGKFYGGVNTGSGAGSILPIDSATATAGTGIPLGSTPGEMVISSDGKFVDSVVLPDRTQIRRFDTTTETPGIIWGLGNDYSALYADDIVALPGSPGSVIVSRANSGISPRLKDIVIYDNGVYRANQTVAGGVNTIEVNEAGTRLYGYLSELSSFDFDSFDIGAGGFSNNVITHPISGYNVDFKYGAGSAFGSNGVVFNADTGTVTGSYTSGGLSLTDPDASTGKLFTASTFGSSLVIKAQDATTLANLGSITVPNVHSGAGRLQRWGTRGLAFRTTDQVFLLRSALVDGALPTLSSVTPSHAQWGATVTIHGTNLLSTNSVKFSGSAASLQGVQVVSDTEITAVVPSNAVSGPITVTTVGGSQDTDPFTVDEYVNPTASVADASVQEGNSGTSNLVFTITLSAPAGRLVTVRAITTPGTAGAGSDYTTFNDIVKIPFGATSGTFSVPIKGDTVQEPDETFTATLSSPLNATLGNAVAQGKIINDDFPALAVSGSSVTETDDSNVDLNFTLALSYSSINPVTVDYTTADGTAKAGDDYVATSGTVTFAPGETTKTVTVTVKPDNLDEPNETVLLRLSNLNGAVPVSSLSPNGHFYQAVNTGVTWSAAKTAAEALTFGGVQGHLATITSQAEESYILATFPASTFWLGGIQAPGSVEPAGGFSWITGEPFSFTSWNSGEPNNANGGEDAIQQSSTNGWNDVASNTNANYLVEYDLPAGAPGSAGEATGTIINDDANLAPTNVSVTPASAQTIAGNPNTLTAVYSDPDGATNIKQAFLQIRETPGAANALYGTYDAVNNKLYLQNDANTAAVGGFAPGSNNVITNSQGTLNCAATTVVRSGNTLTIGWNFTPSASFTGFKNLYLYVRDIANASAGFTDLGDWTIKGAVNSVPVNVSLNPATLVSDVNTPKTLTAVYSDADGQTDIKQLYIQVRETLGGANGLFGYYDAINNKLYLQSDDNSTSLGGFAPGSNNVITNSQGSVNCATTSVVRSGNTITVNWSLTPIFTGAKNVYLYVRDTSNASSGFTDLGDWLIKGASNTAPINVSVTPAALTSGAGMPKTLKAVYSDADNALDIKTAYIQIRATSGGTSALYATYDAVNNKLYLQNDGNSISVGGFAPGSNNVITNSQGSLNCAATSVVRSGNTLTINWNFTPSNAYLGTKNVYLYVRDTANAAAGFTDLGDWIITATQAALAGKSGSSAASS